MTFLELRDTTKTFGGLTAVNKVGFEVAEKEIVGLIGPNGGGSSGPSSRRGSCPA